MFIINKNGGVNIRVSQNESDAVKIAADNLKRDLNKVVGAVNGADAEIIIGTAGVSDIIGEYVAAEEIGEHRETYLHKIADNKLIIAGTDRRGTIYGIYEFCESIGVSPWYYFADVPVKTKDKIELPDDYYKIDFPTVEYRGIFINDEEELENWVQLNMGEETIGVKTYEKIFELLLRLKANYIWPAMHVNSFNVKCENGALADRMGIVVGTSHCDMLMRSNNREWYPWLEKKGYQGSEYDYSVEGRNREILKEYWRESIEQNKDFEVSYTLGMRGIHDSGFEVRALEGLEGDELRDAKIALLEKIISDQEEMLSDVLGHDTMKTFVPYKEVLNLYDAGLNVPEDLTLIWSNDNYGHIRRYPGEKEKKRSGGNGIYYHNSYWAPPYASYLFICSIPLAQTKNELEKAFYEGVKKLWVLNVGALKPIEAETEFFLRYAWEITKETTTADVDKYMEQWINKNFSGNHGKECAEIFNDFDQLADVRKVEFLDNGVFSSSAYGDEWSERVNKFRELYERANRIYAGVPDAEKDAFYQLFLMKIHAGYFMNAQYYYADRSVYCNDRKMYPAAEKYAALSRKYDDEKRRLIEYYNHTLSGGKWNGILTPEQFPPPVAAMNPICRPPLELPEESKMIISVWNDGDKLVLDEKEKWIDIAVSGKTPLAFEIEAPEWVRVSQKSGTVNDEVRVYISAAKYNMSGAVKIKCGGGVTEIPVVSDCFNNCGIIAAEAAVTNDICGWKKIKRLGRGYGSVMEAEKSGGELSYRIHISRAADEPVLEIQRFPSLNSTGRIRVGVSVDDGEMMLVESESNDEHRGSWRNNILNNVDKLFLTLPPLAAGAHKIAFTAIDKYFAFSRFALYTDKRRDNAMARPTYKTPVHKAIEESFYNISLLPRPTVYAMKNPPLNIIDAHQIIVPTKKYGDTVDKRAVIESGKKLFKARNGAVKIDAAAALAGTEYASCRGRWNYCGSESYGRSSIALYAEGSAVKLDAAEAPYLSYKADIPEGAYTVWLLHKLTRTGADYIAVSVDGEFLSGDNLYRKGKLWSYDAEHIWRWSPVAETELPAGEHTVKIYSRTEGIIVDRIYITAGNELPPADCEW